MISLIKTWIVSNFPRGFWVDLEEGQTVSFAEAENIATKYSEPSEVIHFSAQTRHVRCEKAFRQSGINAGLEAVSIPTTPKGGSFSVIVSGGLCLLRTNIQTHCGTPRASRFRLEWAKLNEWLYPQQGDLFEQRPQPPANKLCAMLIVTRNRRGDDPTVPAFVGIGIPSDDLSSWIGGPWPLAQVLAAYSETHNAPTPTPPKLKDKAVPRLKDN